LLAALLIVGTVFLRGDGCIMKDKVIEIIVKSETSTDFEARGQSEVFEDTGTVVLDVEVDKALKDAGYSRDDIKRAFVVTGHYGAIVNNNTHDWTVSGSIDVARDGGAPVQAMEYTSQSVDAALGKKIRAPLKKPAVDLINQAIEDYLNGASLIALDYIVNNSDVVPSPSASDPVNFDWRAWITIHVILEDDVEAPDPF
jgi:hypothetical protein